MTPVTTDWSRKRKDLSGQRESLFEEFRNNPGEVLIAVRLKVLDDKIAECTECMAEEQRRIS